MESWKNFIKLQCKGDYEKLKSFHYKCFLDSACFAIVSALPIALLFTKEKYFITGEYTGDEKFIQKARNFAILLLPAGFAMLLDLIPIHNNAYLKFFI